MSRKAPAGRSVRDALRPRLHRLIVGLWEEEGAARDFSDPEGVHRMRVASRRLRAALDASEDPASKRERRLRKRVGRLARALGAVRDGDVMLAHLGHLLDDEGDHPGITRLVERLERQRVVDRERLLSLLDELDATGFRAWSLTVFEQEKGDAGTFRRRDARDLVRQPREQFIAMSITIPAEDDIGTLHDLRIAAKRLRYVIQLLERPLAPLATAIMDPLGAMQDQLGDIHNDDVLIALIRQELHALVDESVTTALSGGTIVEPGAVAAWTDLIHLLATTARERHERYKAFVQWWTALQSSRFPEQLTALGTPRPDPTSRA